MVAEFGAKPLMRRQRRRSNDGTSGSKRSSKRSAICGLDRSLLHPLPRPCDAGQFGYVLGNFAMPDWMPSLWILIPRTAASLAAVLLVWRAFAAKPDRAGQRI